MSDDQLDLGAAYNGSDRLFRTERDGAASETVRREDAGPARPAGRDEAPGRPGEAPGRPGGATGRPAETPGRAARVAVCDLVPGTSIRGIYLLSAKETRTTKAGKPFFKLRVSDRSGSIDCTVWETEQLQAGVSAGDLVLVTARVSEYQGKAQLEATAVAAAPAGAADARDFLPSTYRDIEELRGFLEFHIGSVYDRDYGALLQAIFDPEFLEVFITAPAAKLFHHAYLGGLVEHTVSVAEMCDFVAQQYARVDRDLLMTAALLHDVGKTRELSFDTVIDFTDAGRFLGHVIQGVTMVSEKIAGLPSFPEEKSQQLLHCIVSHHGELEWGSPKRPKTIEALILHHIDNLDAKVKGFLEIVDGSRDASWTDLRNLFRRPLHVPQANHQEADFLPPSEDDGTRA